MSLMVKEMQKQTRVPFTGRFSAAVAVIERKIQITLRKLIYPADDNLIQPAPNGPKSLKTI